LLALCKNLLILLQLLNLHNKHRHLLKNLTMVLLLSSVKIKRRRNNARRRSKTLTKKVHQEMRIVSKRNKRLLNRNLLPQQLQRMKMPQRRKSRRRRLASMLGETNKLVTYLMTMRTLMETVLLYNSNQIRVRVREALKLMRM
jgi:hypothetical protein